MTQNIWHTNRESENKNSSQNGQNAGEEQANMQRENENRTP